MRHADRLFELVQFLRTRRAATGQQIADELRVSVRTVYRDVGDLQASGIPIRGEAGVGYRLDRGFELPPLTFTSEELEGLALGALTKALGRRPSPGVYGAFLSTLRGFALTHLMTRLENEFVGERRALTDMIVATTQ